jgi:hypothetical protein
MGFAERFFGAAREGAADIFGYRQEIDELREYAADAKLLARRVEDLTFGDLLGNQSIDFHVDHQARREMVRKAYLYYFCVAGTERVLMADGTSRAIADVRAGDRVLARDGDRIVTDTVQRAWHAGRKPVLNLSMAGGRRISVTGEHKVYTHDGWKQARDVTVGEQVMVPRALPQPTSEEAVSLDDAFLIALWLAEGCKTRKSAFGFVNGMDEIRDRAAAIGTSRGWDVYRGESLYMGFSMRYQRGEATPVSFLRRYNLDGMKTDTISVPDGIMRAGNEVAAEFLRTYIACDGSVGAREIRIASASERMIRDLRILASRLGIIANVTSTQPKYPGSMRSWTLAIAEASSREVVGRIGVPGKPLPPKRLSAKTQRASGRAARISCAQASGVSVKAIAATENVSVHTVYATLYGRIGQGKTNLSRRACVPEGTGDLGWVKVTAIADGGTVDTYDLSTVEHHNFLLEDALVHNCDPIVKRTVDLKTFYTFGTGIPVPRYRDEAGSDDDPEAIRGRVALKRYWEDDENQRCLTGVQAQYAKSLELQAQANIFLLLFPVETQVEDIDTGGEDAAARDGETNMKITDLPEREIVEVITHPDNRKIPLYYKRECTRRIYNFTTQSYVHEGLRVMYYRDWRHTPPVDEATGEPWGPPENLIAPGYVYHVKTNATSEMPFGIPEMHSYLKYAKGLAEYMTSRMATVQAIAQLAMRLKVQGGPQHMQQSAAALADVQRLASAVEEGPGSLSRQRGQQAKVIVENQGTQLEPMVADTGAGNAATDAQMIKGQVAAGSGIPVHHLGDANGPNLASAVAMDGPLLKMIRANGKLWETVHTDIAGWMLEMAGLDPGRLEFDMPSPTDRDVQMISTVLNALLLQMDPQAQNLSLMRFALGEILDAMGKQHVDRLVLSLLPDLPPPSPGQDGGAVDGNGNPVDPGQQDQGQLAAGGQPDPYAYQNPYQGDGIKALGSGQAGGPATAAAQSETGARQRIAQALSKATESHVDQDQVLAEIDAVSRRVLADLSEALAAAADDALVTDAEELS